MPVEIDHEGTINEIVCPHCGHKHEDTDFCCENQYEGRMDCDDCGEQFEWRAEFTVEWYTWKTAK